MKSKNNFRIHNAYTMLRLFYSGVCDGETAGDCMRLPRKRLIKSLKVELEGVHGRESLISIYAGGTGGKGQAVC